MKRINGVHILTYPDSLGENLKDLKFVLDSYLKDCVVGVHILPFYPSTGDRGFSPTTHLKVDDEFGNWDDLRAISSKYTVMADLMVNHISSQSEFFQDYLKKGNDSRYADYFVTNEKFSRRILPRRKSTPLLLGLLESAVNKIRNFDRIFHSTGVNKRVLKKVYRPRPESPFVPFEFEDGSKKYLWCTFTKDQIDLDVYNDEVRNLLKSYIAKLADGGVDVIRFDAVGYLVKKRGTSSFMLPETYDFIRWLCNVSHENNVEALPEIHNHYDYQLRLSRMREVDYVYDFQIPFLVLHVIYNKNAECLIRWLKIRPQKVINVLDTHDGLPVVDVECLLSENEIKDTSEKIMRYGGNELKRASGSNGAENVDTYQINCTYYSALGEDDDAHIIARAIQLFIPGIPQIYYVGLLSGKNDIEKFEKTNVGRDVNRHNYTLSEIKEDIGRDVVKRLLKMIEFRNNYPAFDGKFSFSASDDNATLILKWKKKEFSFEVEIDLSEKTVSGKFFDLKKKKEKGIKF